MRHQRLTRKKSGRSDLHQAEPARRPFFAFDCRATRGNPPVKAAAPERIRRVVGYLGRTAALSAAPAAACWRAA